MAFYTPRNITPADQILFDANGDPVGIQPGGSSQPPVLGFPPTKHAAIDSLVSADGNLTINTRDGLGRVTSYVDTAGTTWTVTYGDNGPATVSGGGQTRTFNYTAGLLTGYTAS